MEPYVYDRVVEDSSEKRVADPLIPKPPQKIRSDFARTSIHHLYFSTDAVIHIMRTTRHVANFQITSPKAQLALHQSSILHQNYRVCTRITSGE